MTQAQFNVLDALICSRIGKGDQIELAIWAALAYGYAITASLTTSTALANLALQVWG
jgi:hypothetical protein